MFKWSVKSQKGKLQRIIIVDQKVHKIDKIRIRKSITNKEIKNIDGWDLEVIFISILDNQKSKFKEIREKIICRKVFKIKTWTILN